MAQPQLRPSPISSGGALAANSPVSVRVAALTLDAFLSASIATGVRRAVTRANADGSSDIFGGGTAKISQATAITKAGSQRFVINVEQGNM